MIIPERFTTTSAPFASGAVGYTPIRRTGGKATGYRSRRGARHLIGFG